MRTAIQVALALVAIMALVAGVTYLAQYGPKNVDATSDSTPLATQAPGADKQAPPDLGTIAFATPKVEWTGRNEGDFEKAKKGYHDLWFMNLSSKPTVVGLEYKNCKCTDAAIMPLSKQQIPVFNNWVGTSSATILAGLQRGPLACVSLMGWEYLAVPKLFGLDMQWHGLEQGKQTVTIPPEGAGLLRIQFEGKKDLLGAFLVKAGLWAEPEGHSNRRTHGEVEVPINYVEPVLVGNNQINLETFNAGDEKTGETLVYSTTDAGFNLYATQPHPSPLINVQIEDLNNDEIAEYKKKEILEPRTLAAKRVKVTVHERLSDANRMDLGPFYRKILLSKAKDEPEDATLIVGGEIRGDLVVGAPEDRGRIDLKTFRAERGVNRTVTVLAQQPSLELDTKAIRVYPENLQEFVDVTLEKAKPIGSDKRNRWHLHVALKPGFPPGKFPEGTAVFLQIAGSNPPRQIRIPITGMAYQ
jgi:hypothetical protein